MVWLLIRFVNSEKILFSCWIQVMTSYFNVFNKKRKLVVTSEQIIITDAKNNEIKRKNQHKDLLGVTKSLIVDS